MELREVCNGWRLVATARQTDAGFIATGSAVHCDDLRSHQFPQISGPFFTERAAVLTAIRWLRAWAELA